MPRRGHLYPKTLTNMTTKTILTASATTMLFISGAQAATGLPWIDTNTNLTVYADFRLRYEVDWESHTAAGVERDDRHRGRIRARTGFEYKLADEWSVGARAHTGNSRSQQSPHLTFVTDDGTRDQLDFVIDRYYVQYKSGPVFAWAGRNVTPFWQQHELFWDEDVTPTGLAGSYEIPVGPGKLAATAGAFYLPDGGYDLQGQMLAAQLKYAVPIDKSQLILASSFHFMNGVSETPNNLRNRNGNRDYYIGAVDAQWSMPIRKIPFTVGADVYYNFADYDAADVAPFPEKDKDRTLGYVFSATLGQLKQRHDWLVGYYYAYIETFAVNGSYAQDDWHRFGSGPQTDSSDFKGHEFRAAYAVSKNINLMARLFLVDAITTQQDDYRFRVDLNWKF